MKNIILGKSNKSKVEIDLKTLLRTRLLIQANSGGGKSWLLRLIAERAFGKVQTIIIDPEGEFATLREKYDYVLVGKGGETPADVRSAALVAHKLLELNASAVCDLYEMKAFDRHRWVKTFLDAMIDAPKKLWHPVLIIVDEAHVFCPESKAGESEATEAMIGLATRGRKRGFCPIFATQRLGKLRKDAAAELTNVLIGQTFIDIDRERAAEVLGIPKSEKIDFFNKMKVVEPGNFWALGRAISRERILVRVDSVDTTHPDLDSRQQDFEPPPPPAKIKLLLPKLADLPRAAEEKARTEKEYRAEIAQLKRELSVAHKFASSRVETKERIVEKPIILNGALKSLTKLTERLEIAGKPFREFEKNFLAITGFGKQIGAASSELVAAIRQIRAPKPAIVTMPAPKPSFKFANATAVHKFDKAVIKPAIAAEPIARWKDGKLPKAERSILSVLAQYPDGRTKTQVAIMAHYAVTGGGFQNAVGALKSSGYVSGDRERLKITESGLVALGDWTPLPTGQELLDHWYRELPKAERSILAVLAESYPSAVTKEDVAAAAGYEVTGGGFQNAIGKLRTLELIHGRNELKASDVFFE